MTRKTEKKNQKINKMALLKLQLNVDSENENSIDCENNEIER